MDRSRIVFLQHKVIKIVFSLNLLIAFCSTHISHGQNTTYELSFRVSDLVEYTPIGNASIFIQPCNCGGISDPYGNFAIRLPKDTYTIRVSFIGFEDYEQEITLDKDTFIEVPLAEEREQLSEVIVKAKSINDNVESPQLGVLQLNARELSKIPTALGEIDVLRSAILLPGVNNAGDISNGLSVRGGSLDQNLLLYDYAPVFNPTHLFGLFSIFTPDAVSSVDLYRANIPARFGGRVVSVLNVGVKTPYVDKLKLSGGIGLVSSRLQIETPIIKDKLTLLAGVRGGFTDFLLPIFSERLQNTRANFGDATVKLLYLPTEKDQIALTGFYTRDFYQVDLVTRIGNINAENNQYDFGILNGTLNWTHSFDDKTNLRTIFVGSDYTPKIIFPEFESTNEIEYEASINYLSLNPELSKEVNETLDYYIGAQAIQYKINQGSLDPGNSLGVLPISLGTETSYELATYANVNWNPSKSLSLSGGLRFNYFTFVGPFTQGNFGADGGLLSTEFFERGEEVASYNALEPRLGVAWKLNENTSIKASYARINQYLQNIYNSTTPIPTSRYKTADRNILPQIGDTYGLGFYKNFNDDAIEFSIEAYYRDTQNILTYRPGADFFLEEFIEQDVVQGKGEAYGIELSFRKPLGRINGWFNYTWSRSFLQSFNENLGDRINNNQQFPSDFDRPHVFNGTINFEGDRYNVWSLNLTVQTGRPLTVPNGTVSIGDIEVPIFLERNNARLPTFHRLDFSWKVRGQRKENKRWIGDWIFTMYNVYGRRNPFNIFYTQREVNRIPGSDSFGASPLGAFEISILNSPLFSLTYNFKFR